MANLDNTQVARKEAFLSDLWALMNKYGAEYKIDLECHGYDNYEAVCWVTFPTVWGDGNEIVSNYFDFKLNNFMDGTVPYDWNG